MLPLRLLLLRKSVHPYLLILAPKQPMEHPPLILHAFPYAQILTLVHDLLTRLNRNPTISRNRLRRRQRPIQALLGRRENPRSQPPLIRFLSTERPPSENQLHSLTLPNRPSQPLRPARSRYNPQLDLRLPQIRFLTTVQNIAHHRQLTASPQSMPVHGADDGFLDRGGEFGPALDEVVAVGFREGLGCHFFDVRAGCEGFVGAGED